MTPRSAPIERTATLARAVVSRLAPEELPAFELLAEPYLTGVDDSADGDELQFGVMEAVATVTPVVTLVCAGVVGALVRGAEGELEQLGGRAARGRPVRRWPGWCSVSGCSPGCSWPRTAPSSTAPHPRNRHW